MNVHKTVFIVLLTVTIILAVLKIGPKVFEASPEPTATPEKLYGTGIDGKTAATMLSKNYPAEKENRSADRERRASENPYIDSDKVNQDEIEILKSELQSSLESGNIPKYELMVRALAAKGPVAFPELLALFVQNPSLRRVRYHLIELQNESHFSLLKKTFNENRSDSTIMINLIDIIRYNTHPDVISFLVELLNSPIQDRVQVFIIQALGKIDDIQATNALLDVLENEKFGQFTNEIIVSLGLHTGSAVEAKFFTLIQHSNDFSVVYNALISLKDVGDARTARTLLGMLRNLSNITFQHAAINTIGELMNNKGMAVLMQIALSQDSSINLPDPETIFDWSDERIFKEVSSLLMAHRITNRNYVSNLVNYLGESNNEQASALLRSIYHDENFQINRIRLIEAISKKTSPENLAFLQNVALSSNPQYIRWAALKGLGDLYGPDAIPTLKELIQRNDSLANFAYDSIVEIGGFEANEALSEYKKIVKISGIIKDSQAEKIGLQPGDVIRSYNKRDDLTSEELQLEVSSASILEPVELEIERDGEFLTFVLDGGSIGIYMNELIEQLN